MATKTPDLEDVTPEELLRYIGRGDASEVTKDDIAAFLRAGHGRKLEARILGYLSRVGKKAKKAVLAGGPSAEVVVKAAHRGRITGFAMACSCGEAADKLAPCRRLGELAAVGHLRSEHDGAGKIRSL